MEMSTEKTEEKRRRNMPGQPWAGFASFIRTHFVLAAGMAAFLALVYGEQAFSNYFYIDKEVFVNNPGTFYNWGETGRFGLVLMNRILGMNWYNPYLGGMLFLAGLWLAAMAAGYLFHFVERKLTASFLAPFMLLFAVYPTYAELFAFQFVAYEIVLAMVLLLVSDWYLVRAVRERNRVSFLMSIPFAVIAFGSYQSLVPLQLCLYLGIFLLYIYAQKGERKAVFSFICHSAVHFIAALGIYELIAKIFFSGSNYLDTQVLWRTEDWRTCLLYIVRNILHVVTARGAFFTIAYDLCCGIGLAALVILAIRYRRKAAWYGLGLLGVALSPFYLSFVTGAIPANRTQIVLPMANGVLWLFGSLVISEELKSHWKKAGRGLLVTAGCCMIYFNLMPVMRIFYTRDVVGKADEAIAAMIVDELNDIPSIVSEEKGVIFIGRRPAQLNNACYTLEECWTYVIMSAFELDYDFEPYYYHSSRRILGFLETLGIRHLSLLDAGLLPAAYEDSEDMPVWPLEGSVREFDDYVIVKLGENEF